MARPGTRRYNVDLLANMRLFDSSIKSIKEGEQKLDRTLVTILKNYTAMPAEEKRARSFGQYEQVTKNYSSLIRKTANEKIKKELKNLEKMAQLKAVAGKDILTAEQYKKANKMLIEIGIEPDEIPEYWGYVGD